MKLFLVDESATLKAASDLAKGLPEKAIIYLQGELGAGKTTLVRGLLKACGHQGSSKSPTYTLVEPYQVQGRQFYHFDLYRLGDPEELEYMGIRDYLDEPAVCLLEWPEKGSGHIPPADLSIYLRYVGESRELELRAGEALWAQELVDAFG